MAIFTLNRHDILVDGRVRVTICLQLGDQPQPASPEQLFGFMLEIVASRVGEVSWAKPGQILSLQCGTMMVAGTWQSDHFGPLPQGVNIFG